MLKKGVLGLAIAVALSGCASSAYREVPEVPARNATAEQIEEFELDAGATVLLDLGPSSEALDGRVIAGAFPFQPYELRIRCTGTLRISETREYRSWGRLQSDSISRPAECPRATLASGLDGFKSGDKVVLTVDRPPDADWRLLAVAVE